ncbi:30S ribosomal protein S28e [Candidatus Woesearchaeota archaeon]|nr:30S ribosomal protein S28e [Candidatus Woesearchaeota archaeon]
MAHEDPTKHLKEVPRGQVKRKPQGQQAEQVKGSVNFSFATPAKVEEIIGRTGSRGEAIQIRCRVMDGRDKNKILRRNVKGSIQIGDILMLRETEFEAGQLTKGGRGSG